MSMNDNVFIEIQRLFKLMHERGLQELSLSRPGFEVTAKTVAGTVTYVAPPAAVAAPLMTPPPMPVSAPAPAPVEEAPAGYAITTPLVGIFYRSSSPDAPPFVEIGDTVEVGQTVGIVEAMKVFNEITTDHAGTVIAVPAENGKLVQVGQTLVVIDPIP